MKKFDLNIEKVLEDWEIYHAIREIIANALDEQVLTDTEAIEIKADGNDFVIQDYGRGIRYEHLTQNENKEKIANADVVIGKFGVGLKDAMATFDRKNIGITIKSKYGDITIDKSSKHGFDDIVTLHAVINSPSDPGMIGTAIVLTGCTLDDVEKAKHLFLKFSNEERLEKTRYGEILKKTHISKIYINGIQVAEEENFLFSYNITSMTEKMRKALNRERTHVGKAAYSDRIKTILLESKSENVARMLSADINEYQSGSQHDEMKYSDVYAHACKILNATSTVVFATPQQMQDDTMGIDNARADGITVIPVPDSISRKLSGAIDISGHVVRDLEQYNQEWNKSFEFKFVAPDELTAYEQKIYGKTSDIFNLIGGKPPNIREILISETMRNEDSGIDAGGLWLGSEGQIIIKRDQLKDIESYSGVLIHEAAHAASGAVDVSRDFEIELTNMLGKVATVQLSSVDPELKQKFPLKSY